MGKQFWLSDYLGILLKGFLALLVLRGILYIAGFNISVPLVDNIFIGIANSIHSISLEIGKNI